MRTPLYFAAFLCLTTPALLPAHADTITVTITGTGSGSFGSTQFNQKTVTFTGQTTTEAIAACESSSPGPGCVSAVNQYSRSFVVPYSSGTISVQGFGSFATVGQDQLDFFAGVYDLEHFELGSLGGGLTMGVTMPSLGYNYNFTQSVPLTAGGPTGSFADDQCQDAPASQCPVFAATTGGNLVLTDVYPNVSGEILVSPLSVAPEPAAWTLLGTGLLGGLGAVRRRLRP